MNTKQLLVMLVAALSASTMFGFTVTVHNLTGDAISVETRAYGALGGKEEGSSKMESILSKGSITRNYGLSNTSYVKWLHGGKLYSVDTKDLVRNIEVYVYGNGYYSINPLKTGAAKETK